MKRFLETDRLYLRNLAMPDVTEICDYRNNVICNQYQKWEDFTQEAVETFIRKYENDIFLSTKQEQHFAVCLKETDVLVGELAYFYSEGDCITLGISISYKYHKKGFAYELLKEVIKQIQAKHLDMDIVGLIEKENVKSIGLFEKLGFVQECYAESMGSYVYVIYGKKIVIKEEKISASEYIEFLKRTNLGSQYPKERFAERIEKLVANVPISLVARNEKGKIVGTIFGITDFAYWLFITDLGVDRDYEGLGIGSALVKKAHETAGGEKDIAIYLVANENAIPFYEKLGMKKSGEVMEYNHIEWTGFVVE